MLVKLEYILADKTSNSFHKLSVNYIDYIFSIPGLSPNYTCFVTIILILQNQGPSGFGRSNNRVCKSAKRAKSVHFFVSESRFPVLGMPVLMEKKQCHSPRP